MSTEEAPQWRAQIPADIDRPDPVIGGLSARQLLLLAPIILAAWAAFMLAKDTAPLWVIGVLLVPLLGAATAVAVGRRDGVGLDAYVLAALRWATAPKRRVGAPEGCPRCRPGPRPPA